MIKQTPLKALILLLCINQQVYIYAAVPLNKFKSDEFLTEFIETPTRYIYIDNDKCVDAGTGCGDVAYYEINKKTGKSLKIPKGETINIGPTRVFKGYYFTTKDKKFLYEIVHQGVPNLIIMHPKTYQTYSDEEILQY